MTAPRQPRAVDQPPAAQWVRLAPADALPPGEAVAVEVDGERIALFHTEDGYSAVTDLCPHMAGELSGGSVADGEVTCPEHAWRYDLATGARTDRRGQSIAVYPTEVRDGWLYLAVPPCRRSE